MQLIGRLMLVIAGLMMFAVLAATPARAAIGFADVVLDYFDSGTGPLPGPYGGVSGAGGGFPVAVPTSVVLGSDVAGIETFLSLPTGSRVTVGFTDESVLDGPGNDIFIQEIGASGERAEVYVSSDLMTFVLLGIANDAVTTSFDLASIGFVNPVVAVRIIGLDNGGGSPGFDVVNVQVLPGSIGPGLVSEPGSAALLLAGLLLTVRGCNSRSRRTLSVT
jgi:hypothetical protein